MKVTFDLRGRLYNGEAEAVVDTDSVFIRVVVMGPPGHPGQFTGFGQGLEDALAKCRDNIEDSERALRERRVYFDNIGK